MTQTAFATLPGPYIGVQLGWADLHQGQYISNYIHNQLAKNDINETFNLTYNDMGRAGRLFVGYQFNRYFALEAGYYRFHQLDLKLGVNAELSALEKYGYDIPLNISSRVTVKTDAFDVVGKGILPLTDNFSLFGKLGFAFLYSEGHLNLSLDTPLGSANIYADPSVNVVYPTFGLGINYDITKNVSAEFVWTRIQKVNPCRFPSIDFVGFGWAYHF